MKNNTEKESEKKLQEKLDKIINPLYDKIYGQFFALASSKASIEECEVSVKELLAVAVLEGVSLAELIDSKLDKELASKLEKEGSDFASKILHQDRKLLDAKIALNMNDKSGKFKRFVTADELDENGNLKK